MVVRSEQWGGLSAQAVKLLIDLLGQYRLNNNGDLCATWTVMKRRGWRSRDTLRRALRELLDGGWIVLTRQGGLHAPSLYAVTFYDLDESPKLELTRRGYSRNAWIKDALQNQNVQHATRVTSPPIGTPSVSQASAGPPN
jgi:hypothetical protein